MIGDLLGWRLTFYISVPMTRNRPSDSVIPYGKYPSIGPQADLDWIGTGLFVEPPLELL